MYAENIIMTTKKQTTDSKKFKEYLRNDAEEVVMLPLDRLYKHQAVTSTLDGVRELVDSISENGIKTPFKVVKKGDGYAVISGYKRYLAAATLRKEKSTLFETVPCIVMNFEDERYERQYIAYDNLFIND